MGVNGTECEQADESGHEPFEIEHEHLLKTSGDT
jgi:hypothetical protein